MKSIIFSWMCLFCIFCFVSAHPYESSQYNFTRSRYSRRRLFTTTTAPIEVIELSTATTELADAENDESTEGYIISSSSTVNYDEAAKTEYVTEPVTTERPQITSASSTTEYPQIPHCGLTSNENFPWIAVLEHTNPYDAANTKQKTLSKGVLISPQHVLTTVSSIFNSHPFWTVTKVRLGDIPTWSNVFIPHDKSNVVSVDVEQIFQHDREDIAIIKLQQPVALSELIVPICLPTHDNYYFRELNAHVCLRKTHRSDTSVISVPVSPLLPQDCNILLKRKKASYTQELFCAWDEMGDTCTGDLGSPLTTTTNGRVTVIGLNSFTSAKNEFDTDDAPGIYTRVGVHLHWIRTVIKL